MFLTSRRPARTPLALLALTLAGAAIGVLPAAGLAAGPVRAPLQPLALIGATARPSCDSPTAPFAPVDFLSTRTDAFDPADDDGLPVAASAEIGAAISTTELLPLATICSPTFAGLPAPFGGTFATTVKRSRVGYGWREIGGTLGERAQFLPGDVLSVPEVDDAATLKLAVAAKEGDPTALATFTDLAPGPSEVRLAADPQGLVATLTRADGTTSQQIVQPPVMPGLRPSLSGKPSRWKLTSTHSAGSTVIVTRFRDDSVVAGTGTGAPSTLVLPTRRIGRLTRDRIMIASSDRAAQTVHVWFCAVTLTRAGTPRKLLCSEIAPEELFYADEYLFGGQLKAAQLQRAIDALRSAVPQLRPRLNRDQLRAAHLAYGYATGAPRARAARAAATKAPLAAVPTARSGPLDQMSVSGLRVLAADINGDGRPDYWTDDWYGAGYAVNSGSAGLVLVSGPSGLTPHRVDAKTLRQAGSGESEISAIADVTGDGIGELVVDLEERHALIPGSAAWTSTTFPIIAPDPSDLNPSDRVLAFNVSSPGSPFAAMDDVTGDGVRELAGADDGRAWLTVDSSKILQGAQTYLPSGARFVPAPLVLADFIAADGTAPRVSPETRVIAGQSLALRWPTLATKSSPTGNVTIAVQDAAGRDVRPPIAVQTPGNAFLLDYDRPSGDVLLLSVGATCKVTQYRIAGSNCRLNVLRVGPTGAVKQTLTAALKDDLWPGSARFMPDGPDADASVDTVFSLGVDSVALMESTTAGAVARTSLSTLQVKHYKPRTYAYQPLRLFPVIAADGSRRMVIPLPKTSTERWGRRTYHYVQSSVYAAELVWK